eukprot:jgi/Picsp_1/6048/NSC_03402-R1_cell division cycle 5-like protein
MARRRHRVDLSGSRLEHAPDDQAFSTVKKVAQDFLEELRHIQTCPIFSYIEDEPRVVEQISGVQDWKKVKQGEIEYYWHVPSGRVSLSSPLESGQGGEETTADLAGAPVAKDDKPSTGFKEISAPASFTNHTNLRQVTESIRSQALQLSMDAGSKLSEMDETSRLAIQAATLSQVVDAVFEMFCSGGSGTITKVEGEGNVIDPWVLIGRAFKEEGEKIRQLASCSGKTAPLVTGSEKDPDPQPDKTDDVEKQAYLQNKAKMKTRIETGNAPLPDEPEAPPLPNEPFGVVERPPVLLHTQNQDDGKHGDDELPMITDSRPASQKRAEKVPKASGKTKLRKREATLLKKWEAAKQEIKEDENSQRDDDSLHHTLAETTNAASWRQRALKAGHVGLSQKNQTPDLHTTPHLGTPDLNSLSNDLPEDWQAMWDPSTGSVYYGNLKTKLGTQMSGSSRDRYSSSGGFASRPGLSSRQPLFGSSSQTHDQLEINMEAGTYDIDEDIADLHSSVKRLKHVSKAIQEETSLTQQIVETLENSLDIAKLTLKQTMKRLDRVAKKTRSNHVLYVLLFGLALFFFVIKGGVWKNTEDEILKAAVMKYGLNQWARISSLLVRKSAKQCKARWYEWLDPAIKKTEWTREEDEKLLHLAKLMPTQWRTIAPIVGRTPTQCLERYEKLLDMAAGREDGYDGSDDPRRLRPGEIDPNPETKPARPDPVDMDEEEKEMLSEARARLANTKGKKAKRKAREKQLEEARRLASLQKKRELKAAGIEVREKARRGRGVDYASEVPFERRPAPGFYDISEESQITKEMREEFRPVTKEELEGRKRKDIEKELVKRDIEKGKIAERKNMPEAIARSLAAHDASVSGRRGKMMLPSPQVTDAELEMLAREGAGAMDVAMATETGSEATRALIGDYTTPARFATPMRTPAAGPGAGMSKVMQEAQALARLREGQTPLLGGENPDIVGSDFTGITPKTKVAATPNPLALAIGTLATPSSQVSAGAYGVSATPSMHGGKVTAPTPQRKDALNLNSAAYAPLGDLKRSLGELPAPKGTYQLTPPEFPKEEEKEEEIVEDMAEKRLRIEAEEARAREQDMKLRSSVLQRKLPRPLVFDLLPEPVTQEKLAMMEGEELAKEMIKIEFISLIRFDAETFPPDGKSDEPCRNVEHEFTLSELQEASRLIDEDVTGLKNVLGHDSATIEDYSEKWESLIGELAFSVALQRYTRISTMGKDDRVESLRQEFEVLKKQMSKEAKKADKLEQKLNLILGGLQKRNQTLLKDIKNKQDELSIALMEKQCYSSLQEQEKLVAPNRVEALQQILKVQESREAELQERYRHLT